MDISISNQRIFHQHPLPKGKRFGSSILDIAIVGFLLLITPPLSLIALLMTSPLSFLVKQSAKRDAATDF